jgi:ferric iron reductase protein FhuF
MRTDHTQSNRTLLDGEDAFMPKSFEHRAGNRLERMVDHSSVGVIVRVNQLSVGAYECFSGLLVGPEDERAAVGAGELLDDAMQKAVSDHFHKRFSQFDERAGHSIWMKWYLNVLIPPVLLADVLLEQSLSLGLDELRFIARTDGKIEAIQLLSQAVTTRGQDPFARFEQLVFRHFAPLIEMFSERTDVTPRVYWSNVGNTFEAMLRRIERVSGCGLRLWEAQRLIDEPFWRDGRVNPLFGAVRYRCEGDTRITIMARTRTRRVCCLQYLLPERRLCAACPIEQKRGQQDLS